MGDDYLCIRAAQAAQLSVFLEGVSDPLVMAGDFNVLEDRPVYCVLLGLNGLRDAAVVLDRRQNTIRRANPYRRYKVTPDSRKDFVFFRDATCSVLEAISVKRVFDRIFEINGKEASFSNHDGVLAEFELSSNVCAAHRAPQREAVELTSYLLQKGKRQAQQKRVHERTFASGSLAIGALALAGKAHQISRRSFLRRTMLALPAVTVPAGAGYLALSEWHRPQELETYDQVMGMLSEAFQAKSMP